MDSNDSAITQAMDSEVLNLKAVSLVTKELLHLPDDIKTQANLLVNQQKELDASKLSIKNWELSEMQDITSKTIKVGDKTKAQYSNESARKAELENRKDTHDGFGALENNHKTLRMSVEMMRVELSYLQNRFSSMKRIAEMVAGISKGGL